MKPSAIIIAAILALVLPVQAAWFDWSRFQPSDATLELIVRTGYSGAARHAARSGNYFSRDGEFEPLRRSVLAELARNGLEVAVPAQPLSDIEAAKRCLSADGVELRLVTSVFGDGIALAAVTSQRVFTYNFEPRHDPNVLVTPAEDCD